MGTSGGAWVAINAALERPELAGKIVADSFDGRTLADNFSKNLVQERTNAKKDEMAVEFYQWCQGDDWERLVDMDTKGIDSMCRRKAAVIHKTTVIVCRFRFCSWGAKEMRCQGRIFRTSIVR